MVNFSIFMSHLIIHGPGGLFDLNATLVIIIIQFLILMVCLNEILYKPIYIILEDRKEYVVKNLKESSKITEEVDKLTFQYNIILEKVSKKTEIEIANSEEIQKKALRNELNYSHNSIKNWLRKVAQDSVIEKDEILKTTGPIISSLYKAIEPKLIYLKPLSNI